MSTAREELHRIIEKLQDKDVESLLHLLKRIVSNYSQYRYPVSNEKLTQEEIKEIEEAKAEIARGEYVDFEEVKKEYGL